MSDLLIEVLESFISKDPLSDTKPNTIQADSHTFVLLFNANKASQYQPISFQQNVIDILTDLTKTKKIKNISFELLSSNLPVQYGIKISNLEKPIAGQRPIKMSAHNNEFHAELKKGKEIFVLPVGSNIDSPSLLTIDEFNNTENITKTYVEGQLRYEFKADNEPIMSYLKKSRLALQMLEPVKATIAGKEYTRSFLITEQFKKRIEEALAKECEENSNITLRQEFGDVKKMQFELVPLVHENHGKVEASPDYSNHVSQHQAANLKLDHTISVKVNVWI